MTDVPTPPDPSPEGSPARRPDRSPRPRRRLAVIAGGVALLVVLGVIGALVVAYQLDRSEAIETQRLAAADAAAAADEARRAGNAAAAAVAQLGALVAAGDAALAITGSGIGTRAHADYEEARDAAAAAVEALSAAEATVAPVRPLDEDTASNDELRAQAELLTARAAALRDSTEQVTARAAATADAAAAFEASGTVYATAVAESGAKLLTERKDASTKTRASLQEAIDALPTATTAELADALTAYRKAAKAVIASSDEARKPTGGLGGSGLRISDPSSITAVVNKRRALAASYVPPGLVLPPGIPNNNGQPVRSELVAPLTRMQKDMKAEGITLRISSAYRSFFTQQSIYNGFVAREGVAGADTHSARPGNSEHQTGLAVDLDDGTGCNLNVCFANTKGGKWLAANAWKYGFILRYGNGWAPIVGYSFEPWHYRYVGVDVSTAMHESGVRTLEEYFGLPAAPDYG